MTLDEAIAIAKNVYEDESADARGRKDYRQIAEWLKELKQYKEENQPGKSESYQRLETNLDHHFEYLSEVGLGGFALVNGRLTKCSDTHCIECDFSGDCSGNCNNKRLRWLASPYKKASIQIN